MMVSPNIIYEELLNKSEKEIITKIRSFKNTIGHLKNTIERQNYIKEFYTLKTTNIMYPSYETQIGVNRLYLEEAKRALRDIGGEYVPSKAELRSIDFNNNINNIKKITFTIGGYPGIFNNYIAVIFKNKLTIIKSNYEEKIELKGLKYEEEALTKDLFLEAIRNLYMGEWRRTYSLKRFGDQIMDGTQWELEIEYADNLKKVSFDGSNSYPYNFNNFSTLFGITE